MKQSFKQSLYVPTIFFIFDRIFKNLVLKGITSSNFLFDIHLITNTGISWGLLKGNSLALLFLSLMIVGGIFYYYKDLAKSSKLGTHLILIGAISNILDRIIFKHIIDYIDFRFFPVFNLADACISLGGILLIYSFVFIKKKY